MTRCGTGLRDIDHYMPTHNHVRCRTNKFQCLHNVVWVVWEPPKGDVARIRRNARNAWKARNDQNINFLALDILKLFYALEMLEMSFCIRIAPRAAHVSLFFGFGAARNAQSEIQNRAFPAIFGVHLGIWYAVPLLIFVFPFEYSKTTRRPSRTEKHTRQQLGQQYWKRATIIGVQKMRMLLYLHLEVWFSQLNCFVYNPLRCLFQTHSHIKHRHQVQVRNSNCKQKPNCNVCK